MTPATPADRPLDQCLDTFWHGEFTLHPPTPEPPAVPTLPQDLAALLADDYRRMTEGE